MNFDKTISSLVDFVGELDPISNREEITVIIEQINELVKARNDYVKDPNSNVIIAEIQRDVDESNTWFVTGSKTMLGMLDVAVPFAVLDYEKDGGAVYSKAWNFLKGDKKND